MESTGDGIAASAKLASSVEHSKNDLDCGPTLCRVHIDGNPSPVVHNPQPTVFENRDVNSVAVAGESLIHRVVHDLVNQVVQSTRACRTDVHSGALAHRLETFKYLDVSGTVFLFGRGLF